MKRMSIPVLSLLILAIVPSGGVQAQSDVGPDAGVHWQAAVSYLQYHLPDQGDWRTVTIAGGRVSSPTTVFLELQTVERGGIRELAFGVDTYVELPTDGYVNVRVRAAPGAEVIPRLLAAGGLFHSIGGPWEGWVSYEHHQYAAAPVRSVGIGPGLYIGPWYLRGRSSRAWAREESAVTTVFTGRRFIADSPSDFVEVGAGLGREFVEVLPEAAPRIDVDVQSTWLLSARAQRFLTPTFGLSAGAVYQSFERLGARPVLSGGLIVRW